MSPPRRPTTKYTDYQSAEPSTYAMSPYDKQGATYPYLLSLLYNQTDRPKPQRLAKAAGKRTR